MFGSLNSDTECSKSEIDLFTSPPIQSSISENFYTRVNSLTGVASATAPIEFLINGSSDTYIDPTNIFIYIRFEIKNQNGDSLPDDYECYPETNTLHTLFSDIEVFLNEVKITSGASNYPYRCYIENLLAYSTNEKRSRLKAVGFYSEEDRANIKEKFS